MRARPLWIGLAIVGGLATLGAWGFSFLASALACSQDTSYCATGETHHYRGRLFDYQGRPASATLLVFQSDVYGDRSAGQRFVAGENGRFCISAPEGVTTSFVKVPGQSFNTDHVVRSTAPVDPRFSASARDAIRKRVRAQVLPVDYTPFMTIEPMPTQVAEPRGTFDPGGAYAAVELWNPATDSAPVCTSLAGARWYRSDDLLRSWQYAVLMLAPTLTLVLVLAGLIRRSTRVLQLSCAASAATVLLTYATWTLL
jgi:hypothetical protein